MKTILRLFVALIIGLILYFGILKEEHDFATQANIAKVVKIEKDCGRRSCYYYALVNYKNTIQEINIGRINYHHMEVGKSYDFSPSFDWFLGISGTAYAVDIDVPWYKGIVGKLLLLCFNLAVFGAILLNTYDLIKKKGVEKNKIKGFS